MPSFFKSSRPRRGSSVSKSAKTHHITKNGNQIKINNNLASRIKAKRDARAREKAAYLATLPKGRLKRTLYRMHPKRVVQYWFSRKGGIVALKLTGVTILGIFLLIIGVFAYFRKDLPNLRDISGNNIGGSVRYYDRTGQTLLFEDYNALKRTPVQGKNVSQVMMDATVAVEDKNFFNHGGFDTRGIIRAGLSNFLGHGGQQGGSTITQQLVKLTQNWTKDKSYTRKIKEIILSVELERTYTKKEILAGYLDTAPYSDITYGVEAAMQDYFGKPSSQITLDEAAFLAAIPKSPSYYSPYGASYEKTLLVNRQHYVLDQMAEQGKITTAQRDEAKKVDTLAKLKPRDNNKYANIKAPWFVLTAKEKLTQMRGANAVTLGGLKVTTTLDVDKQKIAEDELAKGLKQIKRQGGDTGAMVSEDVKTGQVVALVGGTDFSNTTFGQNNYARTKLPPGSSFKPYDYLSAIENSDNFGAGTVLYDTVGPIDGYPCTNKAKPPVGNCLWDYDFRSPGPITLRYALGGSRNIPAVKTMAMTGVDKTIQTAESMGLKDSGDDRIVGQGYKCYSDDALTKEKACFTASAIGDGAYLKLDEHVHAYSTISRNGKLIPQTYILKVEDSTGKTVEEWKPSAGKQVVKDEAAYIVADMMSDPNASYFGNPKPQRYKNFKFSVKTGTTNDQKDGWMMGFSTQYATGVWVGYHNRQVEMSGAMETMTQPIWSGYMQKIHANLQPEERQKPAGVKSLPAFVVRSHVGFGSIEPSPSTDLFPSWYKARSKTSSATIDKVSGKLATDCTPDLAKENANNANANQFSADKFFGNANNTTDKDDIHKCEDARPSISLSISGTVITATANAGTYPLSGDKFKGQINIKIDGQNVQSFQVSDNPSTVSYTTTMTGQHNVVAEVIDSVLYSNTDTKDADFGNSSSSSSPLTINSAKMVAGTAKFSWSGNTGQVTIYKASDDSQVCTSNGSSCDDTLHKTSNGTSVYAKDSSGNKSSNVTVSSGP